MNAVTLQHVPALDLITNADKACIHDIPYLSFDPWDHCTQLLSLSLTAYIVERKLDP